MVLGVIQVQLQHLLNDSQLYINLLVDRLFNQEVLEIRKVFNDKNQSWRETTIVDFPFEEAENGANVPNNAKDWKPAQTDSSNLAKFKVMMKILGIGMLTRLSRRESCW